MTFDMNETERAAAEKWVKAHLCASLIAALDSAKANQPTIQGGLIEYAFAPNAVAVSVRVRCRCCNAEEDVSDFASW